MSDFFLRTLKTAELSAERPDAVGEFVWGESSNDLQPDSLTGFRVVSGTEKLAQDIIKILLTERGSNTLFPLYGSVLHSLLGQKSDPDFMRGQIVDDIKDSLIILQNINRDNPNLDEQIQTLESVSIEQPAPGEFHIRLTVITRADKRVGAVLQLSV